MIAFTGSMEVVPRIMEKAARVAPGQAFCKRVVAEMGGKNAIIIDDDADLDEAVAAVWFRPSPSRARSARPAPGCGPRTHLREVPAAFKEAAAVAEDRPGRGTRQLHGTRGG
jgi:hypothetical protein